MMRWYWKVAGAHTHVRVFMKGGKCGDLCFRNEEFDEIRRSFIGGQELIHFIKEE